jgi:uncharacterized protein (TIGR02996 family)
MTDANWLAALAADPDDRLARSRYADWLDDRGDPRAEVVRLDAALADRPDDEAVRGRLKELTPGVDAHWRAAVCRVPVEAGKPFAHPHCHPLNVPGLWYTCGQCMQCLAPEQEAPDLLAPLDGDNTVTHFVRQPVLPDEVERACRAAVVCCVMDVRYGGTDPVVIRRLGNDPAICDHLLPADGPALARPAELYTTGVPPSSADFQTSYAAQRFRPPTPPRLTPTTWEWAAVLLAITAFQAIVTLVRLVWREFG